MEYVVLGPLDQRDWEVEPDLAKSPAEKRCHLQDHKVKHHRASWDEYIVAPKTFNFLYCPRTCLALNSELHQAKL